MQRWKNRPPYRISYRYDGNFSRKAETLEEALQIVREKKSLALIGVHIDLEFDGTERIGSVGILAYQAEGKTLDEVFELFDTEGDDYIACRVRTGVTKGELTKITIDLYRKGYLLQSLL